MLAASAAGRGRPDLELVGAGTGVDVRPGAVDPAELPAGELVRVAASVLADQVVDAGVPEQREPPRRPGRRGGGAATASSATPSWPTPCAPSWSARGRPPGGREPRIVVVGSDLATMAGHAWTHRALTEGVTSWREWLRLLRERREVPARADLLAVGRAWERRVGKARVHVVLDLGAVPRLVGERAASPLHARCRARGASWPAGWGRCWVCWCCPTSARPC